VIESIIAEFTSSNDVINQLVHVLQLLPLFFKTLKAQFHGVHVKQVQI